MQYARPSNGFHFKQYPSVQETLDSLRSQCPWLDQAYADAVARLRMSGHREGTETKQPWVRTVVELNPRTGRKRLGITYHVKGDKLIVLAIRVIAFDGGEFSN